MPDIDTLKQLSELFSVSINELLSGERLDDADFRKEADKNIIETSRASSFSSKEKMDFWTRKWLREHAASLLCSVLFCLGILVFAVFKSIPWLAAASVPLWAVLYCVQRNRMMIYVENHIFGSPDSSVQ